MAIYYSRLSTVCRSKGHSAIAAAAYRAGANLFDERASSKHDYTKRRGVLSSTMLAPKNASWALDVEKVWACAEQKEVRRNARTARELLVALPSELTDHQNVALAHELGQDLVDVYGVAVLVAVHEPDAHGDTRNRHVHLLMSTRVADDTGFGAKVRVLDDRSTGPLEAQALRARVADRLNAALEKAGHRERVDPRSLAAQATDAAERGDVKGVVALSREPTRHQGSAATALMRRGIVTPVVAHNVIATKTNRAVRMWGNRRARELDLAARVRAERRPSPPRTVRSQELRRGLGPVGKLHRAEGPGAAGLNAQARNQQKTMQAERDGIEIYLDGIARALDANDIALRGAVERARRDAEREAASAMRDENNAFDAAMQAWNDTTAERTRARAAHAEQRRAAARAQQDVARSHEQEAELDATKPRAWRLIGRRAWAEHRRRQRAESERREGIERTATRGLLLSAENLKNAEQKSRDARRTLADGRRRAGKNDAVVAAETTAPTNTKTHFRHSPKNAAVFDGSPKRRGPKRR